MTAENSTNSRFGSFLQFLKSFLRGALPDAFFLAVLVTAGMVLMLPGLLTEVRFSCEIAPALPGDYEVTVGYATPLSRNYFAENTRTLKLNFPAGASGTPDFQKIDLSFQSVLITNVRLSFSETTSFRIRNLRLEGFESFRLEDYPGLDLDCSPDCMLQRPESSLIYVQPQRFSSEIMSLKAHNDPLTVFTGLNRPVLYFLSFLASFTVIAALAQFFRMHLILWCWAALPVILGYALNLVVAFFPDISRVYRSEFSLGVLNVFHQYGVCFFILTGCLILSSWKRFWQIRWLGILLFFLFFAVNITDFFILRELNSRLTIDAVRNFGWDFALGAPLVRDFVLSLPGLAALFLLFFYVRFVSISCYESRNPEYPALFSGSLVLLAVGLLAWGEPSPGSTVDDYDFANFFTVNSSRHEVRYSPDSPYRNSIPGAKVIPGLNSRKNVILIDLESFSSYQSLFFGGFSNNMPELDRLAKSNVSFTNYYSNGYASDVANFAILTGFPYINGWRGVTDPAYFDRALPRILSASGYHTSVMYSSRNVFHADELLRRAGFDEFSDGSDPHYAISERLTFNSVPDRDLFDNLYQRVSRWKPGQAPFFTMVLTATTHAPFLMPLTHTASYEGTLRYTDRELMELVAKLRSVRYFDHGIMVIVADHRAMLSLTLDEQMQYGERALGRVPLVIIDRSLGSRVFRNSVGHDSLGSIIRYLILDSSEVQEWQCNPFADPDCQEDVFYQKKGPRDEVLVFRGNGDISRIALDGDATDIVSGARESRERLLRDVYWFRNDPEFGQK